MDGAKVLDAPLRISGIEPVKVAVPRGAEVKAAGPKAAHRADGIIGTRRRGVVLPAFSRRQINVDDHEAAVVLAHGTEQ
jgi:hypothetical protein